MAEYPYNLPVCWWTPDGYVAGDLPAAFLKAVAEDKEWRLAMSAAGYEAVTFPECEWSNYDVRCWRFAEEGPHLLVELNDAAEQLAIMCVHWKHQAAFMFDKWPELLRNQRQLDEPSLNKAIFAFIRHGHGEFVINQSGTENLEERNARMDQQRRNQTEREAARRKATS